MKHNLNKAIIVIVAASLIMLSYSHYKFKPFLPAIGLLLGITLTSLWHDQRISHLTKIWSSKILSYAIILLGFGFNLINILKAGLEGLGYTIISIVSTLIIGLLIGKMLKNEGKISILISVGTAICGGSAVAAVAPIIHAKHEQTAVAMSVIFLLNAIGLFIFPIIGHSMNFDQTQFGILAALAIHDTSSVVGSCLGYGQQALIVGTTIKLVRALWIIPVSLIIAIIYSCINKGNTNAEIKPPWFIFWFIMASLVITIFPGLSYIGGELKQIGESLFAVALFLIGYNVPLKSLKTIGSSVLVQSISLWVAVSICVILAIKFGYLV